MPFARHLRAHIYLLISSYSNSIAIRIFFMVIRYKYIHYYMYDLYIILIYLYIYYVRSAIDFQSKIFEYIVCIYRSLF